MKNLSIGGEYMKLKRNKKNRYGFGFIPISLEIKKVCEAQKITRKNLAETPGISPGSRTGRQAPRAGFGCKF